MYCGLAPEPAAAAYGVEKPDFLMTQMIKNLGYTFVGMSILSLLLLNGMGVGKAIAWSAIPWVLNSLSSVWNGDGKKMGMTENSEYLLLAINAAVMYCGFTDTSATAASP